MEYGGVFISGEETRSDPKCSIPATPGLDLPSPHLSVSKRFKSFFAAFWVMICFLPYKTFPPYLIADFLVPPVQTFTARTRYATCTKSAHPHSLHIPLVMKKFFFSRSAVLWKVKSYLSYIF